MLRLVVTDQTIKQSTNQLIPSLITHHPRPSSYKVDTTQPHNHARGRIVTLFGTRDNETDLFKSSITIETKKKGDQHHKLWFTFTLGIVLCRMGHIVK